MRKTKLEKMLEYLGIEVDPQIHKVLISFKKEKVDENKLAEQLEVRVNEIRKIMYKLSIRGYVSYTKQKSEEKRWWYIYFWELNEKKILEDYISKKKAELSRKEATLEREKDYTFRCKRGCGKFKYDIALEHGFECPECGSHLIEIKRRAEVKELEGNIGKLEKELGKLEK